MSLFIQLPASAPSTIGTIAGADIDIFLPFDADATAFWNFRKASLVAANNPSKSLTPHGQYSFGGNALNITTTLGSMETGLVDTGEFSFCGVVSNLGSNAASLIIAGNYRSSPVSGASLYKAADGKLTVRAASKITTLTVPHATSPLFFGISVSASAPALTIVIKQPGSIDVSAASGSFPSGYVSSTDPVIISNMTGGEAKELNFYEFATYSRALTLNELNTKYLQSQIRMKGVGINI